MKTYALTPAGRRLTLTLMVAALFLWLFAFWTLRTTLNIRYLDLASSLSATLQAGLGAGQLIPAAILIVMLVASPLLLWGLWEEWGTTYTVGDAGLTYRTGAGITLHYPWTTNQELRGERSPDALAELIVRLDAADQIRNPFLRWLHRQAVGANRVPIFADVEARDELVAEIVRRSGLKTANGDLDQSNSV